MGYEELIFDSATAFQSSTKYPATDTPIFQFGAGVKKIVAAKVLEVILPVSWYNFVEYPSILVDGQPTDVIVNGRQKWRPRGHQTWKIEFYNPQTNASFDQALPIGSGTAIEFVQYMNGTVFGVPANFATFQTKFFNLTGNTLTAAQILYTTDSEILTWEFTTSDFLGILPPSKFGVRFQENDPITFKGLPFPAYSLGFDKLENPFTPGLFSYKYTSLFCNANPFNYVYLNSRTLGTLFKIQPNFSTNNDNIYGYRVQDSSTQMAMIPLTENYRGIVHWQDPNPDSKFTNINQLFQTIDFFLSIGPYVNDSLDLNGQSFQVKMGIETEDDTPMYEGNKRARY